jgi:serine/threonine protein kinase
MKLLCSKKIVHRDLKPQNILLSHNNGQNMPPSSQITLKIADFGISRFLQTGGKAATMIGTVA